MSELKRLQHGFQSYVAAGGDFAHAIVGDARAPAERRLLLSLGTATIRVPRRMNPFIVARRLSRLARGTSPDHEFVRGLIAHLPRPLEPSPGPDTSEPVEGHV